MRQLPRTAAVFFAVSLFVWIGSARAQLFRGPTDLSSAELQLIDSAGAAHLENARQLLQQNEWGEAVEAIRRAGLKLGGTVEQSATVDEESGGLAGVAFLAERGYFRREAIDYVLITEPLEPALPWTADWAYLRLRRVLYEQQDLEKCLERLRAAKLDEAQVFFKHEDESTGPRLAEQFLRLGETSAR